MRIKKNYRSLGIFITIAVLLEVVSAVQYYSTHNMLEAKLEEYVLREVMVKHLRIRALQADAEATIKNHLWYAEQHLQEPDTMPDIARRMATLNTNINGAYLFFRPDYYPSKGRLYEPYVRRSNDSISYEQLASIERHDYTKTNFYQMCMRGDTVNWTTPYLDREGAKCVVVSYVMPLHDTKGDFVGGMGVDLSIDWLNNIINQRHFYPSSYNLFLSPTGELIVSPDEDSVSSEKVNQVVDLINDSTVVREKTRTGRCKCITFKDIDGKKAYIYYSTMRTKPHWQIVLVCYDHEVYGDLVSLRINIMLLSLLGLILLGFLIWRTFRNMNRLHQVEMERERIGSELRIAKNIQTEMLPTMGTVYQQRDDVSVCASLEPAKEVGGDLFDHFIRDEKLFFCIGDVSGKGVPAAMVMAVVHSLFRMATAHENSPSRIMQTINEVSCQHNETNMFVTMFIGVLDLPTGHLRYCNAGHDVPVIVGRDQLPAKANLPIGLFDDFRYEQQDMTLEAGDMLFLYTDGLTEAMNPVRQQFTLNRLMTILGNSTELSPEELLTRMSDEVRRFAAGAEQSDDLTMMAIRYTPRKEEAILDETLNLKNDVRQVKQLNEFIKSVTERLCMDASLAKKLRLAVEEAVVNVIDYAYPSGTEGDISVRAMANDQRLKLIISDEGTPFDPTEKALADTTLSAEERPVGGLGILLVRKLMDSINYERIDGKNVLTLRKYLTQNNKTE